MCTMAAVRDQLFGGEIPTKLETAVNEILGEPNHFSYLKYAWVGTVLEYIQNALFFEWWVFALTVAILIAGLAVLITLLMPLPKCLRRTYFPAVIGTGSLVAQGPNVSLLFKARTGLQQNCINCNHHISKDLLYLRQLSGLLRPFHARHKRAVHRSLSSATSNSFVPPSDSLLQIRQLLHPHCIVECFSESQRLVPDNEIHRLSRGNLLEQPSGTKDCNIEHRQLITATAQTKDQNSCIPKEGMPALESGGESLCETCELESKLMRSCTLQREELLHACPSLQEGYTPDSILLRHRLMQGALIYLQEEWKAFKLIEFDRKYWVTSADGDRILLHYCRHRTNLKACATGCRSGGSYVESHAGCTDDRFPRGHPHGLCGCRGILFIVGGDFGYLL